MKPAGVAGLPDRLTELRSNPRIADAAATPLLTSSECAEIVDGCVERLWSDRSEQVREHPGEVAVQSGLEQPVPGGNAGWVAVRIAERVSQVNDELFQFRIVGLEDPVKVLYYRGSRHRDFIDEHVDIGVRHPLRKLSFSLLLSDPDAFEGGDLAFPTGPFAAARAQGTLALFPSFLLHRITPVAAGHRHAVVGYVLGPTFT